ASKHFTSPLDWQNTALIRQRMDQHGSVFARFDDFIEITNGAGFYRAAKRAVEPASLVCLEQIAPDQIRRGQVFVARHRDEGQWPEAMGHVFEKTGLATARGAFQQYRQPL